MTAKAPSKSAEPLLNKLLRRLAEAVYHYPRLFFYPQVFLFLACLLYTVARLEFHTSRDNLVGANKRYHHNFLEFKKEFPAQDDLVVVVESEDQEKNRQFVERLGARLEQETNLFTDVFYKGDLTMMGHKALLFLPQDELESLRKTLSDYRPFIQNFSRASNLVSLFNLVNTQFRTAKRETNSENESLTEALPALARILAQATASLQRPGRPVSPGVNALFGGGAEAESRLYITFAEGRIYLVTARPLRQAVGPEAIRRLRELLTATKLEVPGVNAGLTGELILEVDEMAQSQADTTIAAVLALALCAVIFIYGYRETGRPIKATICLLVGVAYTMGFATLTIGHLNILTITFVPILIGLAIDFGIHLISRYEEELRHGKTQQMAITKAMVNTGRGIITGCLTTSGAFFAMGFTDFKGIQEMGIICGGGLIACLAPMLTLLPVLLLRGRQNVMDHQMAGKLDHRERLERLWLARPWTVIVLALAASGLCWWQAQKVRFDYNLLHMQSQGLPAVEYEQKLINSAGKSVLYGAIIATNLDHARRLEARARALPTVGAVDSLAPFLSDDAAGKLAVIGKIKQTAAAIHFAEMDGRPVDIGELSQTLWSLSGYLGLALGEIGANAPALRSQLEALRDAIQECRKEMLKGDPIITAHKLAAYQQAFFQDLRQTFEMIRHQDNRAGLRVEDLPSALRNRFVGRTGKLLLMVYPKTDVWERQPQEAFVMQLRSVDENATGTPVQLYVYTSLLVDSYLEAARYSLLAIALLVFLQFRNLLCVLLALVPVAVGSLWMIGIMGWREVMFNPANIMTLPLVIGIGVTNGIHVLTRFAEQRSPGVFARSTGKAVLISGLTTIAGFGSLILGKHQGISSLGFVMSIGVATCMLAGVTLLPAILTLLCRQGWRLDLNKKDPAPQMHRATLGREEPR